MKAKKRKLTTSTPSALPPPPTTISSLPDDIVTDILLRLPSAASIARALFASQHWWRIASSPTFLRRLCAVHAYPLLGHFAAQVSSPLPLFHPAHLHSDSVLSAMVRCGDFLLTRLQGFGRCTLEDCRYGLLLFSTMTKLIVFDPVGHHAVLFRRPPQPSFPDHGYAAHTFCLLLDITARGAAEAEHFRVVSLQHRKQFVRAEVFDSGTGSWSIQLGTALKPARSRGNQFFPAMHAAGRIYWKYHTDPILLVLDTDTMRFHYVRAPPGLTSRSPYAVGETDDGECCLVHVAHGPPVGCPRLQVWLHRGQEGGNEVEPWVLVRDVPLGLRSVVRGRVRQVRAVAGGVVLICFTSSSAHLPHVAFRLIFLTWPSGSSSSRGLPAQEPQGGG